MCTGALSSNVSGQAEMWVVASLKTFQDTFWNRIWNPDASIWKVVASEWGRTWSGFGLEAGFRPRKYYFGTLAKLFIWPFQASVILQRHLDRKGKQSVTQLMGIGWANFQSVLSMESVLTLLIPMVVAFVWDVAWHMPWQLSLQTLGAWEPFMQGPVWAQLCSLKRMPTLPNWPYGFSPDK